MVRPVEVDNVAWTGSSVRVEPREEVSRSVLVALEPELECDGGDGAGEDGGLDGRRGVLRGSWEGDGRNGSRGRPPQGREG